MSELAALARRYRREHGWCDGDIERGVAEKCVSFHRRRIGDLIDTLAIGVAMDGLLDGTTLDVDSLSPTAREAFAAAFPGLSIDELVTRDRSEIESLLSAWKGKVFEVEVRDRLNNGEWVGDRHLDPGQTAVLAESANQPGWDLAIHDQAGTVVDTVQLKATESFSYVNEALHRYPNTDILTTSDLAGRSWTTGDEATVSVVSDTSAQDVSSSVTDALNSADGIDLFHVFLPGSAIAVSEVVSVAMGRKSGEAAIASGLGRAAKAAAAAAAGGAVSAILGPWVGVPAGMLVRWFLSGASEDRDAAPAAREVKAADIDPNSPLPPETARAVRELFDVTQRLAVKYSG